MANKKLPCRRIEVSVNLTGKKKNGFMWSDVKSDRKKKEKNTILFAVGFDTYSSALNASRAYNRRLIKKLPIYHRGEEVI